MGLNKRVVRGKSFKLLKNGYTTSFGPGSRTYLVWCSLEFQSGKLRDFGCDFDIKPFLCVQALHIFKLSVTI